MYNLNGIKFQLADPLMPQTAVLAHPWSSITVCSTSILLKKKLYNGVA